MQGRIPARSIVLGTVLLMLFANLGGARLFDRDEALNASCGREMFESGDYVVPTFNGELRTAKPALIYWFMSASYATFGVTEFAARFFSAVASLGTLLCVYACGRMLFGERVGLMAVVVLVTGLMFAAVGRACTPDPFFVFGVTLVMTCFVAGVVRRNGRFGLVAPDDSPDPRAAVPGWGWWCATSAAMGFAVLAKGPAGLVLSCGIIGLYLLWATDARRDRDESESKRSWWASALHGTGRLFHPARIWRCGWAMRPVVMFAIVLAIAAPWYVMVGIRTGGEWSWTFFWHDNVRRFAEPLEGHRGPIVYYIPAILIGLFPWSPFLPSALTSAWKTSRRPSAECDDRTDAVRFVVCWAGFVVTLFSLAGTKLPNYVLPAYPALALLIAVQLEAWLVQLRDVRTGRVARPFRHGVLVLGTCGILLTVGALVATHLLLPGYEWLAFVGVPSLLAGALAHHFLLAERARPAVGILLAGAVGCTMGLMHFAAPAVSVEQDGVLLGRDAFARNGAAAPVATFAYFSPNLVFYSGGTVRQLDTAEQAAALVADDPEAVVIIPEDQWEHVGPKLPSGAKVLSKRREFLEDRQVFLIGREPRVANSDRVLR